MFEIDQPEVIGFKTKTLADLGATPTAERRTVGIDLRDDWPAALKGCGFDTTTPTAWIAEGLLVYLPPEAQDRLLDNVTALSAARSRLATENIADMSWFSDERARAWRGRWRRHGLDIDVADLVWDGARQQVVDDLAAKGWDITSHSSEELYETNGFELPDNEMVSALRGSMSYVSAELGSTSD